MIKASLLELLLVNGNPPYPPIELTDSLELDASAWTPRQIYLLQAALVVPRPIAWVSTIDASGVRNLAPHSYFNAVCDDPPHVLFSIEGESECAVERRGLLVGANPTWQLSLQPAAVGAIEKGYTIGTSPLMQKGHLG